MVNERRGRGGVHAGSDDVERESDGEHGVFDGEGEVTAEG